MATKDDRIEVRLIAAIEWARREEARLRREAKTADSRPARAGLSAQATTFDTVAAVLEEAIEPGMHSEA